MWNWKLLVDSCYLKVTMAGMGCALLFTQGSKGKTSLTAQGEWTVEDKNKAPFYMLSVSPILQYNDSCHSDDSE